MGQLKETLSPGFTTNKMMQVECRIDKTLKSELRVMLDTVIDDALGYQERLVLNDYASLEDFAADFKSVL